MLSWFRAQAKDHGLFPATRLLLKVARYRIPVALSNKLLPDKLECPCCGWKGRRFLDYIEAGYRVPNAACPSCDSHSRHRALYLWLKNEFQLEKKSGGRALIFAPERALAPLWESARKFQVIKTDIEATRGVDLLADLMRLPFASESVELIWCHHVLEQVADDRAAMRELHRVLRNAGGELLVSVGSTGQEKTQEFGSANKMRSGNRRLYGPDFSERLEQAGFHVTPLTYDLSAEEMERYAVYPETFYHCRRSP
ncbi:MAG TPA: methyltransferase domain-containing protein [Pyrinomonadaceae bacterium]|jgi:SAM-dependent methyltransferase|nr:methyltransferase domain-containing protein [Pyrinomonadaceae bacterium]